MLWEMLTATPATQTAVIVFKIYSVAFQFSLLHQQQPASAATCVSFELCSPQPDHQLWISCGCATHTEAHSPLEQSQHSCSDVFLCTKPSVRKPQGPVGVGVWGGGGRVEQAEEGYAPEDIKLHLLSRNQKH